MPASRKMKVPVFPFSSAHSDFNRRTKDFTYRRRARSALTIDDSIIDSEPGRVAMEVIGIE
jgi:hypothetical protein